MKAERKYEREPVLEHIRDAIVRCHAFRQIGLRLVDAAFGQKGMGWFNVEQFFLCQHILV